MTSEYVFQAHSVCEDPVVLMRFTHPLTTQAYTIALDNQSLTHNGELYRAAAFRFVWPEEQDRQLPQATIAIDNVSNELGRIYERTLGLKGADVVMSMVLRSDPDTVLKSRELKVQGATINMQSAQLTLGFENLLNIPTVAQTYRPETHPGLF